MSTKPKGLGRGLAALLERDAPAATSPVPAEIQSVPTNLMPLAQLRAGRYQPRTRMDESALTELAQSLNTHGMMQPIVVRPINPATQATPGEGATHEIIAGERRFRAAKLAGLVEVPVIVRDVPDEQALALALIENIQREDLNPLEEAQAIKRLIEEFNYSHDQAAQSIGRSRSATSNLLRLLNLADPVQTMLLAGDLDMGHARALLSLDRASQTMLAVTINQKRLSVREAEKLVARQLAGNGPTDPKQTVAPSPDRLDRDIKRLQDQLCDVLGTDVKIQPGAKGSGKLVIAFSSLENFEGLLSRIGVQLNELG